MSVTTKRQLPNVNNNRIRQLNSVLIVKFIVFSCFQTKKIRYDLEHRREYSTCSTTD